MPARPLGEPVADQQRLVGGVVVHDQMDVEPLGHVGFDLVEELAELGGAVACEALADHLPGCDVEGGEQRGRAMALVVMAHTRRLAWPHRQHGLAAVEGLDLRLLIDAQHDGVLGRGDIETDDIAHLGDELGIGRQLERLQPVWLQAESPPDALYARNRQP